MNKPLLFTCITMKWYLMQPRLLWHLYKFCEVKPLKISNLKMSLTFFFTKEIRLISFVNFCYVPDIFVSLYNSCHHFFYYELSYRVQINFYWRENHSFWSIFSKFMWLGLNMAHSFLKHVTVIKHWKKHNKLRSHDLFFIRPFSKDNDFFTISRNISRFSSTYITSLLHGRTRVRLHVLWTSPALKQ